MADRSMVCRGSVVSIAVCILAKDEAAVIADALTQLCRQTFITDGRRAVHIHVVANGTTDDTVARAQGSASLFEGTAATLHVHDLHPGGKSRAWNKAVHSLTDPQTEIFVFLDADIHLASKDVVATLLDVLEKETAVQVCSGFPVKDLETKEKKSLVDRFSLKMSARTRHVGVVNGSLYAGRASCLRSIWLPDETPGEDGFLNAMVMTDGFSKAEDPSRVRMVDEPTHFFEAHSLGQFVNHERRLIVATVINRWIFELLWSLKLTSPAGELIDRWNREDPNWVEKLIRERGGNRAWMVPNAILFGRFGSNEAVPLWKRAAHLPAALAATLLTLPPAVKANGQLKRFGASKTW